MFWEPWGPTSDNAAAWPCDRIDYPPSLKGSIYRWVSLLTMKVERRVLITQYSGRRKVGTHLKAQTPLMDQWRSDQFGSKKKKRRERGRGKKVGEKYMS